MKDMILAQKKDLEERGYKGFTLMEMLIVIAIIAVLVAIAIPVFTTQLEKAKEGTDIANLRSAYAAGQVAAMTGYYGENALGSTSALYYKPSTNGALDSSGDALGQGTATDGKSDTSLISGWSGYTTTTDAAGKSIKVTFDKGMVKDVNFE